MQLIRLMELSLVHVDLLVITGDSVSSQSMFSNQFLWFIIITFSIALISLIAAYRLRNAAFKLARVQKNHLQSLNNQLTQQSAELTKTNTSKDQLISVISHDLRAPLASLDSCLEIMLTEDLSNDEKDELIRDLQKETYNTLKTLDDLLAWARLQQKGGNFEEQDFNLVALVNEVMGLYQPVARHKSVEIQFEPLSDDFMVKGDPNQIRTVLRNLVSNGIKFTPEGSRVTVELNLNGKGVEVSVKDEGKGISKADLAKIKDPENYYSSRGTNGENGTGVGLMLSFEFIRKHNSELQLVPALPAGTRASFHLNLSTSTAAVKTV